MAVLAAAAAEKAGVLWLSRICFLKCSDVLSLSERQLSAMALQQNLSAPPLAAGAAGEVLAGLEQSWDAALPSQNLLSNCSVSGCTLSSSAYILPFGVPQSLKMCASHLQTARKGEKCLKCVCVWCFRTFFTHLFFIQKVAPNGLFKR